MNHDLYSTALYFRILRQHGYHVSEDAILQLLDDEEKLITSSHSDDKARAEFFYASHLSLEGESLLDRAKAFATKNLRRLNSNDDDHEKIYSPKCSSHWSVVEESGPFRSSNLHKRSSGRKFSWTGFCKALFVEAKWYDKGHCPSLWEYLDNGWTSSSGPVLSLHALFGVGQDMTETMAAFNTNQEIIYHASLIIRLYNDQGTSKAELERGDAPSSILCYMREANVTEAAARDHIRNVITNSWKKINGLFISSPHRQQPMIRYIVNTAQISFIKMETDLAFKMERQGTKSFHA
ncbi:hypothetical protein Pfo_013046 [Paulownia fortunei]|nr:hypothetical protein Pfo_013046 [Paulownia fortunei]